MQSGSPGLSEIMELHILQYKSRLWQHCDKRFRQKKEKIEKDG